MDLSTLSDSSLLKEIDRRFKEKQSSIEEMEFLTKKLLELNEKSKKAQEVKSQFLSLVKNEFNNPVSSLLNVADMLKKANDLEKVHIMGDLLKRDLLKMDFSLKNIFAASEIEAGETANDYNYIDLQELFNELKEYFEIIIKDKNLTVDFNSSCEKDFISDTYKIYLILLNLLSNACEFSFPDTNISVDFSCDDESFVLNVKNVGEVIKPNHTKEIYNRFVHFESGTTRQSAGLGLGLSVSLGMCEALDGTIGNETKDGLTEFIVKIPILSSENLALSQAHGSNEFMFDLNDEMVEF